MWSVYECVYGFEELRIWDFLVRGFGYSSLEQLSFSCYEKWRREKEDEERPKRVEEVEGYESIKC